MSWKAQKSKSKFSGRLKICLIILFLITLYFCSSKQIVNSEKYYSHFSVSALDVVFKIGFIKYSNIVLFFPIISTCESIPGRIWGTTAPGTTCCLHLAPTNSNRKLSGAIVHWRHLTLTSPLAFQYPLVAPTISTNTPSPWSGKRVTNPCWWAASACSPG